MNKKKLLALLMALVMTLTLVPVTAFAEASSLPAAENGVITLAEDVKLTNTWTLYSDAVLDLNGQKLTMETSGGNGAVYLNGHSLTIKDTSAGKTGTMDITSSSGGGAYGFYVSGSGSQLSIEGGSITVNNAYSSSFWNAKGIQAVTVSSGSTFTMTGGSLTASNANYSGKAAYVVYLSGGTANIFGGAIICDDHDTYGWADDHLVYNSGGTANITGGKFKSTRALDYDYKGVEEKLTDEYELAAADTDGYRPVVPKPTYVAKLDENRKYETLDAAYEAAAKGDTITLLQDITYGTDREVPVWGKAVNLDLNDHTLTTDSTASVTLSNDGYKASAICYSIPLNSAGNVTISNGTIVTAYGAGVYADDPGLTLTLENLTINAGNTGTQNTPEYTSAVRITGGAKVIINSGSYSSRANALTVSNSGGEFVVNGGTFSGKVFSSYNPATAKIITINGGKFSGTFENTTGTITINGGVFTNDAKTSAESVATLGDGKSWTENSDSTYPHAVGEVKTYVAQIGDTKYETLAEAIEAAADGDTVKLLQNIDLDSTTTIEKSITIDGNNKTLTVTNSDSGKYALYVIDENEPVQKKLNVAIKNLNMTTTGYQVAVMLNGSFYSTLALNNVNITCDGECVYANGLTSASANNCNFTHEGTYATGKDPVYYSALIVGYGGNLEVSNCTVTSFGNGASTFPSGGFITLTNTDITIDESASSNENAGYAMWSRNEDYATYPEYCRDSVITFHSGKVSGDFKITDKYTTGNNNRYDAKIVIDGGVFSKSPADIDGVVIKTGYQVIANTDENTSADYPYTVGVNEEAFEAVEDAYEEPVTTTSGDTTFSFATATTENPNDDVTYAIKTTTTENENPQVAYTPVQTDVVTKPAVSENAANASGVTNEAKDEVIAAVEASAASGTTEIQAKQGNTNVDLLTTQAAAKAITKAAAAYNGAANNIAKVEIQLQTELTSYTLADENSSVVTTALIYQVTPKAVLLNASGVQLGDAETLTNDDLAAQGLTLQFQLPVPDSAVTNSKKVNVTHRSLGYEDSTFVLDVLGEAGNYYVVIETTHFSEFELEPVVVADSDCAKVLANLTLADDIAINFDVSGLAYAASRYTVEYSFNGEETITKNLTAFTENDGHFKVTVAHCAAKQMTDTVRFKLKLGGTIVKELTDYSVQKYCLQAYDQSYDTYLHNLCKALLNYGTYAQHYFDGYNSEKLANDITEFYTGSIPDADAIIREKVYHFAGTKPGNSSCNINLTLVDKTEMNFTFSNLIDTDEFSVIQVEDLDNDSFTPLCVLSKSGSTCTVKIKGIPAKYLNHRIELSYQYGSDQYSITFSPLSYVYLKKDQSSDYLGQLCRALYGYWAAADEYFTHSN